MSFERTDFPFPDDEPDETPAAEEPATEPQDDAGALPDVAPPQIVAETPIGGMPRPVIQPPAPDRVEPPAAAPAPDPDAESGGPDSVPSIVSSVEAEADATQTDASEAEAGSDEGPSPSDVAPATDAPLVEAVEAAEALKAAEAEAEANAPEEPPASAAPVDAPVTGEPAIEQPVPESPTLVSRPTEPKPLFAAADKIDKPDEWDDDLSPELAAILFSGEDEKPARSPDAAPTPAPAATAHPAPAPTPKTPTPPVTRSATPSAITPSPATPPPAQPVHLTDTADARTLPISAEGISAAAPETRPEGKARYVRVEEPLKGDQGQRTSETWEYQGPDRPQVKGRELRTVKIEEFSFADGSWKWRFERKYGDRGYDRRTVRANADRSYVERVDEINAPDDLAGKRVKRRDEDAMILAAPVQAAPPHRGLLSRLFGRGAQHDVPRGDPSWRSATLDEVKHARRTGGDAF
ncbi:hypothetical protein [Aggregatilinea lenta]|uniref:hypothetical protein n=1 Tax=Aggregatilinea lenta TaxID=913108 RepID=UPI000E5C0AD9|nr:hypothetical protein [Aggregatilinea lenta]